jgi:hypothetical protein
LKNSVRDTLLLKGYESPVPFAGQHKPCTETIIRIEALSKKKL